MLRKIKFLRNLFDQVNKMNKQKGFTIIELIVVIAIIAILAGIVLVNVTQYINKAKDSTIKANISTILTDAQAYYSDTGRGNGSFSGYLTTATYGNAAAGISSNGGTATAKCNDSSNNCTATTATSFCVSSPMATSSLTIYCQDSAGKVGSSACAAGACP